MQINSITAGENEITEIVSDVVLIRDAQDAIDIIGNTAAEYIVMYEHNFEKEFFDLSTLKLGDILQKFSNFRVKLAIIGDFTKYPSTSLQDFIYETNRQGDYLFVPTRDDVIKIWKK